MRSREPGETENQMPEYRWVFTSVYVQSSLVGLSKLTWNDGLVPDQLGNNNSTRPFRPSTLYTQTYARLRQPYLEL